MAKQKITIDVRKCARCRGDHKALEFTELNHPIEDGGHQFWASCPINGEPILLLVRQDSE